MQSFILRVMFMGSSVVKSQKRISLGQEATEKMLAERGFACLGGQPRASSCWIYVEYSIAFFEEENGLLLSTMPQGFCVRREQATATLQWRLVLWNGIGWDVLHGGLVIIAVFCAHPLHVLMAGWVIEFKSHLKGHTDSDCRSIVLQSCL